MFSNDNVKNYSSGVAEFVEYHSITDMSNLQVAGVVQRSICHILLIRKIKANVTITFMLQMHVGIL